MRHLLLSLGLCLAAAGLEHPQNQLQARNSPSTTACNQASSWVTMAL